MSHSAACRCRSTEVLWPRKVRTQAWGLRGAKSREAEEWKCLPEARRDQAILAVRSLWTAPNPKTVPKRSTPSCPERRSARMGLLPSWLRRGPRPRCRPSSSFREEPAMRSMPLGISAKSGQQGSPSLRARPAASQGPILLGHGGTASGLLHVHSRFRSEPDRLHPGPAWRLSKREEAEVWQSSHRGLKRARLGGV